MLLKNPSYYIARRYFTSQNSNNIFSILKGIVFFILGAVPMVILGLFVFLTGKEIKIYRKIINLLIAQNLIQMLTNISMIGVGIGAGALIIILSIFNGLEDLTRNLYGAYNPEIKITPAKGKSFEVDSLLISRIQEIAGVNTVTEVIEDDAFLRYKDASMRVIIKGVSDNFHEQYPIEKALVLGQSALEFDGKPQALLGFGVMNQLSVQLEDEFSALVFHYPRKGKKVSMDPERALVRKSILPGGILAIEQQFDTKYVIVPLAFTRDLLQYENKRTSLEIKVTDPTLISSVQGDLQNLLGEELLVKNADEQQASVLRAVKIERLFVFIGFTFILIIVSFNVFFSLAMLVIEKKKDLSILISMGATKKLLKRIFLLEGSIIALSGAFFGLLIAFIIVFIQQEFGVIPLGVPSSIVEAYPVKLNGFDFLATGIVVILITILASYLPAKNAANTIVSEHV
ncbi:ABC transporter permease [Flexithrix dorotheae]|uniref:ABC transporter permease n=1 Tax=Flexithrix dorotheae TaxID=70993 RepID=UPI00037D5DAF|nr:FtsX-like permease family protein [Flexithrix dorotheae]